MYRISHIFSDTHKVTCFHSTPCQHKEFVLHTKGTNHFIISQVTSKNTNHFIISQVTSKNTNHFIISQVTSKNTKLTYESKPTCPCLFNTNGNVSIAATRIFCQAPPVFVGDPANLTCHFPEDLSQSQKSIAVLRRDSIPGSRDGEWSIHYWVPVPYFRPCFILHSLPELKLPSLVSFWWR